MTIWIILPLLSPAYALHIQTHGIVMSEIRANCGRLEVQGYNSCEIFHSNNIITYRGPPKQVYSDRRFGLISYTCDHKAGYFMSNIECERCNFECSTEGASEELQPCPVDPNQFWAGLFLGIFTAVMICCFGFKRARRVFYSKSENSDNTRRGSFATIYKNDKVFLQRRGDDDGRIRTADSTAGDPKNYESERSPKTKRKNNFMTAIAGLLLLGSTDACDVMITVDSGNVTMVCHESRCAPQASFPVRKGQEICIENHQGERVSLGVTDILSRVRYRLAYYTADYRVILEIAENCCTDSDENNCWDKNGNCHRRAKEKLPGHAGNRTINFQCLWSNDVRLYTNCAYIAKLLKIGDLYEVFKKIEEIREIQLSFREGPSGNSVTLSELNPTRNLNLAHFKMQGLAAIPISLVGSLSRTSPSQSLLRYDKEFYYVNGSEPGEPQSDMIGDFQVPLTGNLTNSKYAEPVIACESRSGSCDCKCSYNQNSTIKSFQNRRGDHKVLTQFVEIAQFHDVSSIIDAFKSHEEDEMLLILGNGVNTLGHRRGMCHVQFFGSHGCTSCENPASILFEASEIEKVGLLPFRSNCTFDRYTIKCDNEPTELVLRGKPDVCYFRMPTLSQEFSISMKYLALGRAQPEKKGNCTRDFLSVGEALEHLVTGSTFIGTFLATVILIVTSAACLLILFKLFHNDKPLCPANFVQNADDLLEL